MGRQRSAIVQRCRVEKPFGAQSDGARSIAVRAAIRGVAVRKLCTNRIDYILIDRRRSGHCSCEVTEPAQSTHIVSWLEAVLCTGMQMRNTPQCGPSPATKRSAPQRSP